MNAVEARANETARRQSAVRCDRIAWASWHRLPDETRAAIEAAIPDGYHLTLGARRGIGDYTARLFRGSHVVAQVERYRYVEDACHAVLAMAERMLLDRGFYNANKRLETALMRLNDRYYARIVPAGRYRVGQCIYGYPGPAAPDPSWTEGPDGYVRAPLENRGTL